MPLHLVQKGKWVHFSEIVNFVPHKKQFRDIYYGDFDNDTSSEEVLSGKMIRGVHILSPFCQTTTIF